MCYNQLSGSMAVGRELRERTINLNPDLCDIVLNPVVFLHRGSCLKLLSVIYTINALIRGYIRHYSLRQNRSLYIGLAKAFGLFVFWLKRKQVKAQNQSKFNFYIDLGCRAKRSASGGCHSAGGRECVFAKLAA